MRTGSRTALIVLATAAAVAGPLAATPAIAVPTARVTSLPAAAGLTVDGLTATWQANSWAGSTGSPPPQPTTTTDCGVWSGGDGTQVVRLGNGDNLWSFGDSFLGPAVARQDFFNSATVHNSMVRQSGSTFTTITGGTGCPNSPTQASAPVTSAQSAANWPASSITYGSNLDKFYYAANASALTQLAPEVAAIPQSTLETASTVAQPATELDGCLSSPIMWGSATISATTSGTAYTYIYGDQQATHDLYVARTTGDPANQSQWQYYTGSATNWPQTPASSSCGQLALAPVGGSDPIAVATEFSVTIVNGDFWLFQDDVAGSWAGWAAAHEATTPWSFSGAVTAEDALFQPGVTAFGGINDSFPGQVAYSVRMMDPAAVTASSPNSVVVAYNVNTSSIDTGCVGLIDYDANAYRPRFIDVPTSDLVTGLGASPVGRAAVRPAAAASWTYSPDAVPTGTPWGPSCPASYVAVDPQVTFAANPDGSIDLSWPNQGADVWYHVHWRDITAAPGTWNENEFWSAGPKADGWQTQPAAGLTPSDSSTIRLHFVPATGPDDAFDFWIQAFAAGDGSVVSPDSAATPTGSVTAALAVPGGLTATTDASQPGVTLHWTGITALPGESVSYTVGYKLASSSTWTYLTDFVTPTADVYPLQGGQTYDFKVAADNAAGQGGFGPEVTAVAGP